MEGENFIIVTDDDEFVLSRRSYQPSDGGINGVNAGLKSRLMKSEITRCSKL